MRIKTATIFIIGAALTLLMSFAAFAQEEFPFELEFDTPELTRLCYSGHNETVKYKEGAVVLPETCFMLERRPGFGEGYSADTVSATIGLKYENDSGTGSVTEILRTYSPGTIELGETYSVLSDNIIANLDERDLLYGDPLRSLYITLKCQGHGTLSEVTYLYMAQEDEFFEYLYEPEDEPEEES